MEIILPNREEWLKARERGLGASDSGTIIGVNPWKTTVQLWEEKVGIRQPEDISNNPKVKLGHDEEPLIRALFALENPKYEVIYESAFKMIFHDEHDFIFATLDGELIERATGRKGILEIKTTEIMRPEQWKEWDGRIPDSYYSQVCHQLNATGWDFAVLKVRIRYIKDGNPCVAERQYTIERTEAQEDMAYLLQQEIKYWEYIQKRQRPPLLLPAI